MTDEDSAITFETFRKFQRKEKKNEKLQELPGDFFKTCVEWINRKQKKFEETSNSTLLREIENVKNIVSDIFERRRKKILLLALHSVRSKKISKNLLPEEKEFFEKIVSNLRDLEKNLLEKVLKGETPEDKEKEEATKKEPCDDDEEEKGEEKEQEKKVVEKNVSSSPIGKDSQNKKLEVSSPESQKLIEITNDVDKFVATDENEYGPLEEGDVVTLPKEVARLLVEKDKAKPSEI